MHILTKVQPWFDGWQTFNTGSWKCTCSILIFGNESQFCIVKFVIMSLRKLNVTKCRLLFTLWNKLMNLSKIKRRKKKTFTMSSFIFTYFFVVVVCDCMRNQFKCKWPVGSLRIITSHQLLYQAVKRRNSSWAGWWTHDSCIFAWIHYVIWLKMIHGQSFISVPFGFGVENFVEKATRNSWRFFKQSRESSIIILLILQI